MKFSRWFALPVAAIVALAIGAAVVMAAPSPSPSGSGSTDYGQVFVNKLAAILHLSPAQTQENLKQAQLQTVDQMVKDTKITPAQADALKSRINSGSGIGFPFRHFGARIDRGVFRDVRSAELDAVAGALKMSRSDLEAQLRSGKTLSALEQEKGVSNAAVRGAKRDAAKGVLDKAVEDGKITQSQEDAFLSKVGSGGRSGHIGFRPGPPPDL